MSRLNVTSSDRYKIDPENIVDSVQEVICLILSDATNTPKTDMWNFINLRYEELLRETAFHLTCAIADDINREFGLVTDVIEMSDEYDEIIDLISDAFDVSDDQVSADLTRYLNRYSSADIITAKDYRLKNKLH